MQKFSLREAPERPCTVDRTKLDATTEEDIQRHREEDGYGDLEIPETGWRASYPPHGVRPEERIVHSGRNSPESD